MASFRHHDSQKKAAAAKMKEAAKEKAEVKRRPVPERKEEEDREEGSECEESREPSQFAKRAVASNWTKYELPSSSDGEGDDDASFNSGLVGRDFEEVLEQLDGDRAVDRREAVAEQTLGRHHGPEQPG